MKLISLVTLVSASNLEWADCGGNLYCTQLLVPLDHKNQDSRKISIPLIKYKSKNSKSQVLVNPGGPGDSGVESVRTSGETLSKLAGDDYDIIGFDPRGVGNAIPVICGTSEKQVESEFGTFFDYVPFLPNNPSTPDIQRFSAFAQIFGMDCKKYNDDTLGFVSTPNTARDMDLIRQALGMKYLNFIGLSYGTFLGNVYANLFPDKVGKIVLDGVVNPAYYTGDFFNFLDGLKDADKVLDQFYQSCDGSPKCPLKIPGKSTKQVVSELETQLERGPMFTQNNGNAHYAFNLDMLHSTLLQLMYTPSKWPNLASAVQKASAGNVTDLFEMEYSLLYNSSFWVESLFMPQLQSASAILCADTGDSTRNHSIDEWAALVNAKSKKYKLAAYQFGCRTWPVYPNQERYTGPWNNTFANTIMVIGNSLDPSTPFSSAQKVVSLMNDGNLKNAILVHNNGTGHTSLNSLNNCITKIYQSYFKGKLPMKGKYKSVNSKSFVLINPGGPGGSGVATVRARSDLLVDLVGDDYDIIGFDPRGVGDAIPVICGKDLTQVFRTYNGLFDQGVPFLPYDATKTQISKFSSYTELLGKECQKYNNDTLGYVSTPNTARDMDLIRDALGMKYLNYIGFSYGTFLGNVYANLFPDRVGKFVIDGVVNPEFYTTDYFNFLNGLRDTDKAVNQFYEQCDLSPECPLKVPGKTTRQIVADFQQQLANKPMFTQTENQVLYTLEMFDGTLFTLSYSPPSWPKLAEGIQTALNGNVTDLFSIQYEELFNDKCGAQSSFLIQAQSASAILCADTGDSTRKHSLDDWAELTKSKSRLSKLAAKQLGWELLTCRTWPFYPKQERYTGPWNNHFANTIMIVGNSIDPVTPFSSAQYVESLMNSGTPANSILVHNNGTGHTSLFSPNECIKKTYRSYFNGILPVKGTVCQLDKPIFGN
ncbi:hypothetical protein HDV06_007138 [Boothiomyces sp. JEL0866]|nr:hypothetical protein HDV06_007138 [Boothiomyces sp. JEL0866]